MTQEAREAFEARQREEKHLTSAVVLDPKQHPELAYHQLRVLVSQLQLLQRAAGSELLSQQVDPRDPDAGQIRGILQVLQTSSVHVVPPVDVDHLPGNKSTSL